MAWSTLRQQPMSARHRRSQTASSPWFGMVLSCCWLERNKVRPACRVIDVCKFCSLRPRTAVSCNSSCWQGWSWGSLQRAVATLWEGGDLSGEIAPNPGATQSYVGSPCQVACICQDQSVVCGMKQPNATSAPSCSCLDVFTSENMRLNTTAHAPSFVACLLTCCRSRLGPSDQQAAAATAAGDCTTASTGTAGATGTAAGAAGPAAGAQQQQLGTQVQGTGCGEQCWASDTTVVCVPSLP